MLLNTRFYPITILLEFIKTEKYVFRVFEMLLAFIVNSEALAVEDNCWYMGDVSGIFMIR